MSHLVDAVEVEPQTYWRQAGGTADPMEGAFAVNREQLARCRRIAPHRLLHSVGFAIGGAADGDSRHLDALRETFGLLEPSWWSEHLNIVRTEAAGRPVQLGFLMPPLQTAAAVEVVADRIRRLQDAFGLPFAFETGVNYLAEREGQMPDGAFWGSIAERADCGILLDVHNVWCNAFNGRQSLDGLFDELPLERVWEIHLAGGQLHDGFWLDSHSDLPQEEIFTAAERIIPRLGNLHAIIFEIIPDQIDHKGITRERLADCLERMRRLWTIRGNAAAQAPKVRYTGGGPLPASTGMDEWERLLANALRGDVGARSDLGAGLDIYRSLISLARRGMLAEALPLSLRYLLVALGEGKLEEIFGEFWVGHPVHPFMSGEAQAFGAFARTLPGVPHLAEVLDFELGAHAAALTGISQVVHFTCDPSLLLDCIVAGREVPRLERMEVEFEIAPPG